jgi:hypothetical protein
MKSKFYKHLWIGEVGNFLGERPDIGMSLERMQNYIAEQLRERQIELEKAKAGFANGEITEMAA